MLIEGISLSLYAEVTGGSQTSERNAKHYLQVISQSKAISFVVLEKLQQDTNILCCLH